MATRSVARHSPLRRERKPAHESQSQQVSYRIVKRHLRAVMQTISDLRAALERLEGGLSAPSPEVLRQFKLQRMPITQEALLLGVLRAVRHSFAATFMLISDHIGYTPAELRRQMLRMTYLDEEVLRGLSEVVHEASARKLNREKGEKP